MPEPNNQNPPEQQPQTPGEITDGATKNSDDPCDFWHVLPVRYALCQKKMLGGKGKKTRRKPPLKALTTNLPQLSQFDYTLRTLRTGWVHLAYSFNSKETECESYYFDGTNFTCTKAMKDGSVTIIKGEWIKIPKKALRAEIAFSPAKWTPEVWKACMDSARMQFLSTDPSGWKDHQYCAPIDKLSEHVEEYKEIPEQLCSLVDWKPKIFGTPPIKIKHANDKGITKEKSEAIKTRWEDSAEKFNWRWAEGGKSKLQDAMEKACPSPNDAYFVALFDPIGCTQDMAKINVSNTQILALYNSWYGYPQLIAEMADRYIKAKDGKDKKEVLATSAERGENYSEFLKQRADEAGILEKSLDSFFGDWGKYLKPNGQWRTQTISILADEYPKGSNRAGKKVIAIEREREFARCITMICAHNKGKEIIKSYFFDNKKNYVRQFNLLQEILAGGEVPPPPIKDHDTADRQMPVVINHANDTLANILISIRTAMLDLGNMADKTVYKELMDMAANRLDASVDADVNAEKEENKVKFFPPILAAAQSHTIPITLNDFGMLLERCMRQIQEPIDQWTDWTKEMPKPTPDESSILVEFAQITSIADTASDAIGYSDLSYIKQNGTFPPKSSSALSAFKAFKGITLPIAIMANAAVLSKDRSLTNIAGMANLVLTASLSITVFADAVTVFKPTLLPRMIAASGGKLSQDAAMKIIQANTARFIGGIGVVVQGAFDMVDLYSRDEVIEAKVGLVFSCLGQLLLFSFNPVGIVLGGLIAIGGTLYSNHFRRGFEDDWFRTSYWGKAYHAKVGKYPSFSLTEGNIDPAQKIVKTVEGIGRKWDVSVVDEFKKSLESYIYYGQQPNFHIYVENADAYVAIVAPAFKHGHSSVYFGLERIDKTWEKIQAQHAASLEEQQQEELKKAESLAETKAYEAILPSVNMYLPAWRAAYESELSRLHAEINRKYKTLRAANGPKINWGHEGYYKVPMRMRIVEGAACCEMVLDLEQIAHVYSQNASAEDVILAVYPQFTYEKGMRSIHLPLPESKTFQATDGVEFVPEYEWKKHEIKYRWKMDEKDAANNPYYVDTDVLKWEYNRYKKIIKQANIRD